jgi:enediyne biosynthesis protein E4
MGLRLSPSSPVRHGSARAHSYSALSILAAVSVCLGAAGVAPGCSDDASPGEGPGTAMPPAISTALPETPAAGLSPLVASCASEVTGEAHFTDATDKWELGKAGLDVTGGRAMVADLDGDGYPDVIVNRVSSNTRTELEGTAPKAPAAWPYRVLMNRPSADGTHRRFVDGTLDSHYGDPDGADAAAYLRSSHLSVAADIDNDGDLDLFQGTNSDPAKPSTDPGDRSRILLNDGHGVFSPAAVSDVSPLENEHLPTTALTLADVDRDGRIDAFAAFFYVPNQGYGYQAQLYRGAGDGTFALHTGDANLYTEDGNEALGLNNRPAYGVTSCDLNDDGAPEILVSAYGRQWNLLYQNDGVGKFQEIGQKSGFAGDDIADFSDNQFFACYCTVDRDSKSECAGVPNPITSCPDPADANWGAGSDDQPWRNNGNTFTTVCADLDGDGKLDLYNAEIAHWWAGKSSDKSALLRNKGASDGVAFERMDNQAIGTVIPHVGVDWNEGGIHAGAGDFNNDGRQDLLVGMSDYPDQYAYFFSRDADGKFSDKAKAWGIKHPCAVGPAIADFDRDGDLDIILAASTMRDCAKEWPDGPVVRFYENDASEKGGFFAVRLHGNGQDTNKAGVGAKITIRTGDQLQVRELDAGYGHMGLQADLVAFFGVGSCTKIDTISVRWPNQANTVEEWHDVAPGALVTLTQGETEIDRFVP